MGPERVRTLSYGDTPPSLNVAGTRGSHWAVTREKGRWQGIFTVLLLEAAISDFDEGKLPRRLARVEAEAILYFRTKRRRDEGNYRWLLEKALGDALVTGGFLRDDTPELFTFGRLTFEPARHGAETLVVLHYREAR